MNDIDNPKLEGRRPSGPKVGGASAPAAPPPPGSRDYALQFYFLHQQGSSVLADCFVFTEQLFPLISQKIVPYLTRLRSVTGSQLSPVILLLTWAPKAGGRVPPSREIRGDVPQN